MGAAPGTIQVVLRLLRRIIGPLEGELTVEAAPGFFAQLGVPMTAAQAATLAGPLGSVNASVTNHIRSTDDLDELLESGDLAGVLSGTATAIVRLVDLFDRLPALGTAIGALPGLPPDFATTFPRRLFDHLITELLATGPGTNEVLELLGILDREDLELPDGIPYTVDTLRLDRVTDWLSDPAGELAALFDWGTPGFDGTKLLQALARFLGMLGLPALVDTSGPTPILDVAILEFRPRTDLSPAGVGIRLEAGTPTLTYETAGPGFTLRLAVEFGLPPTAEIVVQPDGSVTVEPPPGPSVSGGARATLTLTRGGDDPLLLFGTPGGSRLEAREISFEVDAGLRQDGAQARGDLGIGGEVSKGKLVLDLSSGDGFLTSILPAAKLDSDFEFGFGFSLSGGLHFHGSGALEIQLPVHVSLGPIELTALTLSVGLGGEQIPIHLTTDFKASLGPVTAVVQGVGLGANLALADGNQGNLGPLDLSLAFRPPRGVGLVIDAEMVTGGGFLFFDPQNGEYAGALELELAGLVDVKAIGLITTRMPDGSKGFSLLILMTAEFGGTGIQLGYGFTLLAVGGLIGLNRRMNLQALVEGVRTGRTESVMFPRDVVANAPRILSDLRAYFPPQPDTFLVGPMAKIGWGTPALLSISLGVIVEIPGNIAVLGVLKCVLPTKELPLLVLQVDFVGALEFDRSRLWFFARLFDSRVLTMTVDGGMGLLIAWGDNPDLVVTVGGFHPSFKPPPLPFPVPDRISVDILNQPGRLIRVSGYFAVTSNTVQFGARAELKLGFDDFGIQGHLAFDALFRFSPFAFVISISAGVTLKAFGVGLFGITLRFTLEGPAPWRAHGRGSISLLFFEISANFDITWGESHNTTLPPVGVLALLATEITKLEGWQTQLPTGGGRPLVNLRPLPETDELVLHPLGTLFIRQRSIPLNVRLDRVGAQRPSDGKRFSVAPVPDSGLVQRSVTGDKFAMAQFQDMDDAAKLSRPSYEDQDAGLELAPTEGALASVRVVRRSARYEMSVIDSGAGPTAARVVSTVGTRGITTPAITTPGRTRRFGNVSTAVFGQLLLGSSTTRSPLSQREARLRQPFAADDTVRIGPQRFVIAHVRNNRPAFPPLGAGTATTFRSLAAAADALAEWIAADPALAGQLHVVPESEASTLPGAPGTWTTVGPAPYAAAGAAAVRLTGGPVLIAGGADADGDAVDGAALFDPVSDTWVPAPSLTSARRAHTATRLADGRVLVAGGIGAGGTILASAEIYDPVAGTWSTVEALGTPRLAHSATLLPTGEVLVAGGTGTRGSAGEGTLASAELFDPATGSWSDAEPMTDARSGHQAVPLPDGRVLVVGGTLATGALATGGGDAALAFCERYDPQSGAWTPAASLAAPRVGHQASVLLDGSVLVTGGGPAGPERYDPAADKWTPAAPEPARRSRHRSVRLRSGRVLLIGGTGSSSTAGYRSAVAYDPPASDPGSPGAAGAATGTGTGGLATGRFDFTAIELADGRVLVAGGQLRAGVGAPGPDAGTVTGTAEVFTP